MGVQDNIVSEKDKTVRVAAVGDIHVREGRDSGLRNLLEEIAQSADVLCLCGDLTNQGLPAEARALAADLNDVNMPVVAVLGNHDMEGAQHEEVTKILCDAGVQMLDGDPVEFEGIGFGGVKGFAGGFGRHMLEPWGEKIIKEFVYETINEALSLESSLARLHTPVKIAVLHYAPIADTVVGEPPEIFPYLGSSRLAEPLNRFGVAAAFHGHAHQGCPEGQTETGVPVYNVSLPVMRTVSPDHPYRILEVCVPEAEPANT